VAPLAGLVKLSDGAVGVGVGAGTVLLDGAPDGTIGLVPSLLIVIGADVVRLPARS